VRSTLRHAAVFVEGHAFFLDVAARCEAAQRFRLDVDGFRLAEQASSAGCRVAPRDIEVMATITTAMFRVCASPTSSDRALAPALVMSASQVSCRGSPLESPVEHEITTKAASGRSSSKEFLAATLCSEIDMASARWFGDPSKYLVALIWMAKWKDLLAAVKADCLVGFWSRGRSGARRRGVGQEHGVDGWSFRVRTSVRAVAPTVHSSRRRRVGV
jgi:hypothetical protein